MPEQGTVAHSRAQGSKPVPVSSPVPVGAVANQRRTQGGRQLRALAALSLALVVMGACTAVLRAPASTMRGIGMMRIAASGGRAAGMQVVVLQRTSWD